MDLDRSNSCMYFQEHWVRTRRESLSSIWSFSDSSTVIRVTMVTRWENEYGFGRPLGAYEVVMNAIHHKQMWILARALVVSCETKPYLGQIDQALRYLMKWNPSLRMAIKRQEDGSSLFCEQTEAKPRLQCFYNETDWQKVTCLSFSLHCCFSWFKTNRVFEEMYMYEVCFLYFLNLALTVPHMNTNEPHQVFFLLLSSIFIQTIESFKNISRIILILGI